MLPSSTDHRSNGGLCRFLDLDLLYIPNQVHCLVLSSLWGSPEGLPGERGGRKLRAGTAVRRGSECNTTSRTPQKDIDRFFALAEPFLTTPEPGERWGYCFGAGDIR